jgi:hypothetical protein
MHVYIQIENAIMEANKNKNDYSVIGFTKDNQIIRYCNNQYKWLIY